MKSANVNFNKLWNGFLEAIAYFVVMSTLLVNGCITVDKSVTVHVYRDGTATVDVKNSSETKADGNTLAPETDLQFPFLP